MTITLNGQEKIVPEGLTVQGLLQFLDIPSGRVAVEVNQDVVRKHTYATTPVNEGDRIEVVSFMGGGEINSECGLRNKKAQDKIDKLVKNQNLYHQGTKTQSKKL